MLRIHVCTRYLSRFVSGLLEGCYLMRRLAPFGFCADTRASRGRQRPCGIADQICRDREDSCQEQFLMFG
jgi:hypothetical protein